MKLLVVNLQDPSKTHYHSAGDISYFFLGKRLSNYKLFLVPKSGSMEPVRLHGDLEKTKQNVVTLMKYYSKLEEK